MELLSASFNLSRGFTGLLMRWFALISPLLFLLLLLISGSACGGGSGGSNAAAPSIPVQAEVFVAGTPFPSALAFSPDGRLFYAELPTGTIRSVEAGVLNPTPVVTLEIPRGGSDGIYGIAFDPDFSSNNFFYVFYTTPAPNRNRVVKFRVENGLGIDPVVVIDNLPYGGHNGGKLAFARDKTLHISTGDSSVPDAAQLVESFAGKILRLNSDGSVPSDNPFPGSAVFAIGFRNVFGMAFHPRSGDLYASDNGPDCDDEINHIQAGGNYGWRLSYVCGEDNSNFISPITRINPPLGVTDTVFYQGAEFQEYQNYLLLADFNTGAIRRYGINAGSGTITEEAIFFEGGAGPIIDLAVDSAGLVYAATPEAILRFRRGE